MMGFLLKINKKKMHQLHFLVCQADCIATAASKFKTLVSETTHDNNKFLIGGITNLSETEQIDLFDLDARWSLAYLIEKQHDSNLLDTALELCKNEALNHLENCFYGTLEQQFQSCLEQFYKLKSGEEAELYKFDLLEEQAQYLQSLTLISLNIFPNQWDFLKLGVTSFDVSLDPHLDNHNNIFLGLLDFMY